MSSWARAAPWPGPGGYRGAHLQPIWGPVFRRPRRPRVRRERWETPDGDFLDLDWLVGGSGPLVLILHGLEGSSLSHYASGLLAEIAALGWRGAVINFRSCSGELNRLPRLYHSGETSDLGWVVARLVDAEPGLRLGLGGGPPGG